MTQIKVLVVDDAVVFRKGISDALAGDPDIAVQGTAANGRIALSKMALNLPDVVVLDVEMPELDGLATLSEIRRQWPKLPVIMCSALTKEGAQATIDALERGADDFVTKPVSNSVAESIAHFRNELIPRIKSHCRKLIGVSSTARPALSTQTPTASPRISLGSGGYPILPGGDGRVDLVVIGVSTGGPNALAEIIPRLPGDLPVPVLIVQHMPPMFTKMLAERLAAKAAVAVQEASAGAVAEPGQVWLAPGGYHLVVSKPNGTFRLGLNQDAPENSCRPAVDVLFRSAATAVGGHLLAVVLTGMGEDGCRGCQSIRGLGGQVIVQDKATSVVWGMPGRVAGAGLAEKQLPLGDIAGEIVARVRHFRPAWAGTLRQP